MVKMAYILFTKCVCVQTAVRCSSSRGRHVCF